MRFSGRETVVVQNNIPALRKERKLTQAELADELEVTRQTIISIEKGKYTPSLPLAMKIADVFDKRVEEVFSL